MFLETTEHSNFPFRVKVITHRALLGICFFALATLSLGCANHFTLVMKPSLEPVNDGSKSPELASKKYQTAMVIPPTGAARGTYDDLIALFETEFLRHDLTLITSVMATDLKVAEGKVEAAAAESDLAKPVKRVEGPGAEVVIKVIQFEWSKEPEPSRFFILESLSSPVFLEVYRQEYQLWRGQKYAYSSPVLRFTGKIVDVPSGQVLETFNIQAAANWSLPKEYAARLRLADGEWILVNEIFRYKDPWWIPDAKKATERKVLGMVAKSLKPRRSKSQQP